MRVRPVLTCALVLAIAACGGASARVIFPPIDTAFTVYLGCAIKDEKVIVITNTSGGAIVSKAITYDAERKPDHVHYGRTFTVSSFAAGAVLQIGAQQSFSCRAWFKRTPVAAPNP